MYSTRQDNDQEIKIHYEVIGDGIPLVLHHGNGNRIQDWHTLGYVQQLAKDFKLILIDSRGYGASTKPHDPAQYGLQSRADDTIAVLNDLGIQQVHCMGGSVGSSMNFILARFYPDRLKSLIFATPYFTLLDAVSKKALLDSTAAYLAAQEEKHGTKITTPAVRETILSNDAKALWAVNSSEWFDYQDYIHYIKVPSLIYVGSEERSVTPLERLATQLPGAQFHVLPGLKHAEAYGRSEVTCPLIREFILSVEEKRDEKKSV